jgi:hypothetical protein
MGDEARMPLQPTLHAGMFMRAVVVHHDMQLQMVWKLFVQPFEKFQELLVAMPRIAFSDHFAFGQLQRGKERGRPVPLVVVGHRSAATALERQSRLRAIQGLDLALFINTEHQGLGGRIQIQPHHVGQLLQEVRVSGQLETRGAVRFDLMTLPDPVDRGLAHPLLLGHGAATPVGRPGRFALQRALNDGGHLRARVSGFSSTPGSHFPQTRDAFLAKTPTPERDGLKVNLQVLGNLLVLAPVGRRQNDLAALRHLLRSAMSGNPAFQFQTIHRLQGNRLGNSWHALTIYSKTDTSSHLRDTTLAALMCPMRNTRRF